MPQEPSPKASGLDQYRAKRSASQTPEPFGGGIAARRFVIQKHAARRMHYDLRLEWDGVLHSWAVPRGPSTDPQDKRLAVMTEDHPLNYADFEGLIPQGNYGAGAMIVWDQGLWIPLEPPEQGLKEGKLVFELRGYKMRGVWELILPKKSDNEWLLFKKKDAWAGEQGSAHWTEESVFSGLTVEELRDGHARAEPIRKRLQELEAKKNRVRASGVKPMLAETADAPFSRPGWCFELKYDGYRVLGSKEEGKPHLYYRSGIEATAIYPAIARTLGALPYSSLVLDGEVVVLDDDARPSFQRLQKRARLSRHTDIVRADVEHPAVLYIFDLLGFEDFDLRPLPYATRKELLRMVVPSAGPLRYSDHVEERGLELYEQIRRVGLEGLMAKKADAPYRGGRTSQWLKIRLMKTADFVIVGYSDPSGARSGFGSLDLAVHDGKEFVYSGRVGTGFNQKRIDEIYGLMQALRRDDPPCAGRLPRESNWVEPRLVCEVRYTEWTEEKMLRHPVFERLRDDKTPEECRRPFESGPEEEPPTVPDVQPEERKVVVSRPKKIFWPEDGYTKGDLVEYYRAVSPWLLPILKDRLVVLTRYPDGIHGKWFFQKDAPPFIPDWMRTERLWSEHTQREIDYFMCENVESLLYLANLATIPLHIWSSRIATLPNPDWSIIDLDPKEAPFTDVVALARAFKKLCDEIGLPCYAKTSGSSGMHVLVPLERQFTYQQSKTFAELLSRVVETEHPKICTLFRSLDKREGKVYLDTVQNGHGRLLVSPYSVRPLPAAPVSTPLHWSEVDSKLDAKSFTIKTVPERLAKQKSDPWKGLLEDKPDLTGALSRLAEKVE